MLASNPRLIWVTIAGFEREPMRPGYDFVMQAECGWMSVTGEPDGTPLRAAVAFVDVLTGRDATIALLAAVAGRERGTLAADQRHVVVTLERSAIAGLANVAQNVLVSGTDAARWGNAHANLVPYQLFAAADRPIVIAVGSDAQWQALAGVLGDDALLGDPAFATNAGRVRDRERCVAGVAAIVATRPAAEWMERCARAGVPAGLVRTVREALTGWEASAEWGVAPAAGGTVRRPPPALGEHSSEIRAEGWGGASAPR
jgi:crotonobetainyl-CoA:carnitine CoA-transferase CaiB-like acyl-CoA transferase